MPEKLSSKQELIVTLDKAWELLSAPTPMNLAIVRGLLDHGRAVAKRVGEEGRAKKVKRVTASPHSLTGHERRVADASIPLEGGGA